MKISDIPAERLEVLNNGQAATTHLSECLAIDCAQLLRHVFPQLPASKIAQMQAASSQGIVQRLRLAADILASCCPECFQESCCHISDTVRSFAAFMIGKRKNLTLQERLVLIKPLANDAHFGVREYAGVAMRDFIIDAPEEAIEQLTQWAYDSSPFIRRFACEFTRPRGVWVAHFTLLKKQPELALPILEPLKADPERYVQDSVGNWLNDASKTRPDFVQNLCQQWLETSDTTATRYIIKRALRTLRKAKS